MSADNDGSYMRNISGNQYFVHTVRTVALLMVILIMCSGCSVYTFNPKGKSSISSIYIFPFENITSELTLTERLTTLITDAFIAEGSIKLLPEENAEAVLIGSLNRYERLPHRFDQNDQVEQYKVVMSFDLTLRNPTDQTDIWKEVTIQEGIYDAATETEEVGQSKAVARLVEAILNKTITSW